MRVVAIEVVRSLKVEAECGYGQRKESHRNGVSQRRISIVVKETTEILSVGTQKGRQGVIKVAKKVRFSAVVRRLWPSAEG